MKNGETRATIRGISIRWTCDMSRFEADMLDQFIIKLNKNYMPTPGAQEKDIAYKDALSKGEAPA